MSYFTYHGKQIFFEEFGQGEPLIFLHGNTASSKMFELLMPLYAEYFRCILIDFLGNGQSDRIERFPVDMWHDQALQTIGLIEYLNCGKVSLVGTSGGAWVAVNAGLERGDLVKAVIADSFDGRTLNDNFAANLVAERTHAKSDLQARGFYEWCQGEDWETVVDLDTDALLQCANEKCPLFHKSLDTLEVPVLLTGSRQDDMCRKNLEEEYCQMAAILPHAAVHIFETGGHPSMASNAEKTVEIIQAFIQTLN